MSQQSKPVGHENAGPQSGWAAALICGLLALAVWGVFRQTRHFDFINYDDDACVYENPVVTRGLSTREIVWTFTHESGRDSWFPLTDISHMADWQFYGPDAGGHHVTNVLLHAATAVVLFLALWRMTGGLWASAFAAAVFAIHPLRVQSVAWVAERKDVLSGLLFMLALWTWGGYARKPEANEGGAWAGLDPRRKPAEYYWALVFFGLGLLCKATLVTLPVALCLLDYWPLRRFSAAAVWRLFAEKVPFLLVCAAGCAVTVLTQRHVVAMVHGVTLPWRLGNAAIAYVNYLGHTIYPAHLALLYAHPEKILPAGRLAESVVALILISVGVVLVRRRHPYLLTGWFWYLGMFLPAIDIMQAGDQARADRYSYLPQIGLCIMAAWGAAELLGAWRYRRVLLGSLAGVVLGVLLVDSHAQTRYWRDSVTVWTHTLVCTPGSYIAQCNLGIAQADRGEVVQAVQHFNLALELNPDDAKSINNLGKVLAGEGKLEGAIADFNRARQLNPNDVKTLENLGVALAAEGRTDEAIADLQQALAMKPQFADGNFNLGNVYLARADLDDAAQYYQQALDINPDFAEAHCNLGLALARQGDLDGAMQQYQEAVRLKPDYPGALNDLGGALAAQGNLDEAEEDYQRLLALKPDDVDALNNLGVVMAREGKTDEAVADFDRVVALKPDDASAHNNLGIALAKAGKLPEAMPEFQEALDLARAQNNFTLEESIRARLKECEAQGQ